MTFTINATVAKVIAIDGGEDEGNTLVRLTAKAGEEVERYGQPAQAIYSNTEGVIKNVSIHFIIEGTDPPLTEGDVVSFTGHFTKPASV